MSKKAKIITFSVIGVILACVIVLVAIEGFSGRKYTIKNNTDKNITNIRLVLELAEEETELQELYDGPLNAGSKVSGSFKTEDFDLDAGDLGIYLTFEGGETMFLFDGYFEGRFDGKINMEFYQEEGTYRLKSTASSGLFGSTENTGLDESVIVFSDALDDWDYIDGGVIDFEDWDDEDDYDDDYDYLDFEDDDEE
ncbi:MAG: hypothetical protein K5795_02855 [Lachnospiraceae bacterium]|nr:hypothetical protein [Lachnospiraceae bacterium]